jgi:DNA-binding FrmR family transcriptional regulator
MKNSSDNKNKLGVLRRIEEQVRGVQRMIENHESTLDILTQTRDIKAALNEVGDDMLQNHLQDSITEFIKSVSNEDKQQELNEILKVISKTRKE